MKKSVYIIFTLGIIALIVVAFLFVRGRIASPASQPGGELPTVSLPDQGQQPVSPENPLGQPSVPTEKGAFGVVAQNPVDGFFVDPENVILLVQPDGQVFKITKGEEVALSSSLVVDLIGSAFSFDGKKVFIVFGDQAAPQVSVFDIGTKTWQPLALGSVFPSIAWSPNDYRIAYLADKNGTSSLATLDVSNPKAKPQELLKLRLNDAVLQWVGPQQILFIDKTSSLSVGSAWSFDLKKKTLSLIIKDRPGLGIVWGESSPPGLTFTAELGGKGGKLNLIDGAGRTIRRLNFLTLSSKCSFFVEKIAGVAPASTSTKSTTTAQSVPLAGKTFLDCAIPRDAQALDISPLPDAYQKKSLFTVDDFYRIDVQNGIVSALLKDSPQALDGSSLKVFNGRLFFVNRFDQKLYTIPL